MHPDVILANKTEWLAADRASSGERALSLSDLCATLWAVCLPTTAPELQLLRQSLVLTDLFIDHVHFFCRVPVKLDWLIFIFDSSHVCTVFGKL